MDLKNMTMDDLKQKFSTIDKKTLIKFGIGFGAIILFLIIYYAIVNPMVKERKAKYQDKIQKEQEIVDFESPQAAVVKKEGLQLGVIAQEIEEYLPEIVKTQSTGVKSVDPNNLTWYLVNAVKELSAENTALKSRLDAAGL